MNKLKLYGKPDSSEVYPIRDFLLRSVVDFKWIGLDKETELLPVALSEIAFSGEHPTIEFPDGQFVVNPTLEELASYGLDQKTQIR